jgi:hypothetical protein
MHIAKQRSEVSVVDHMNLRHKLCLIYIYLINIKQHAARIYISSTNKQETKFPNRTVCFTELDIRLVPASANPWLVQQVKCMHHYHANQFTHDAFKFISFPGYECDLVVFENPLTDVL